MTKLTKQNFALRYVVDQNGCWIWQGATRSGQKDPYGWAAYAGKQMGAHRVSWLVHRGSIPDGLYVCHRCDVRKCVNPDHLFLGTPSENMRDMWSKGRHKSPAEGVVGSLSAKLTALQARAIYARALAGERTSDLAKEFSVSQSAVSKIKSGGNWSRYV